MPLPLRKDSGIEARRRHDEAIAEAALGLLRAAVEGADAGVDASADAVEALFARPVFELDGTRSESTSTGLYLPATLNPLHAARRRDIPVPFPFGLLFRPLEGRVDLSSRELRRATA